MSNIIIKVDNINADNRVDIFLTDKLENLTRSNIQKLIKDNCVTVNKKNIKHNYRVKNGDIIDVILKVEELNIKPEKMELDIIYEDKYLIVLNKEKGVVVHPASGNYTGTLVNGLMYHCKGNLSEINGVLRPGIVHRIDKDTCGILVVAKCNLAHLGLSEQLAKHTMVRRYKAIVINNLKDDTGIINAPLGRHSKDRKKMAVVKKGGKNAITHYKVLTRFGAYTFIEVQLETGRTHQIRVHMSYIGNPILGDEVYGRGINKFGVKGQLLQAYVLGFEHPILNKYMEFKVELTEEFKEVLKKIGQYIKE